MPPSDDGRRTGDARPKTPNPYEPYPHPTRPSVVLPVKQREAWDLGYAAALADERRSEAAKAPRVMPNASPAQVAYEARSPQPRTAWEDLLPIQRRRWEQHFPGTTPTPSAGRFRVQEAAGEFQARGPWRKTREEARADGELRIEAARCHAHNRAACDFCLPRMRRETVPARAGGDDNQGGTNMRATGEKPDPVEAQGRVAGNRSTSQSSTQDPTKPDAPVPAPREVDRSGGASGVEAGAAAPIDIAKASKAAQRLIDVAFGNVDRETGELVRARFCIPARQDDDDLILMAALDELAALRQARMHDLPVTKCAACGHRSELHGIPVYDDDGAYVGSRKPLGACRQSPPHSHPCTCPMWQEPAAPSTGGKE